MLALNPGLEARLIVKVIKAIKTNATTTGNAVFNAFLPFIVFSFMILSPF